jgi:mono/diheme cytochrome c family protein
MSPRLLFLLALTATPTLAADPIHFGRQIRPILSENCFFCHGPDEAKREAGLRLDDETAAKSDNDGTTAIVPGHPEKSALLQRILSTDPDEVMPPPKLHKVIPPAQIALLTEWIKQGAPWGKHWSYEPIKKPSVPKIPNPQSAAERSETDSPGLPEGQGQQTSSIRNPQSAAERSETDSPGLPEGRGRQTSSIPNPVDAFLLARLTQEKLTFSPEAPPHALLRRLALDLTGLAPTLEEIDRLLPLITTDYPAVVDHYLAKPAYGEHWASQWMDLARYADSSGYPSDQPREIWAWRDWVISAFNRNQPFDQFTIDQLAGDLLPQATQDQLIATAFHRNTMTQNEGGTSDEEFRNAAIIDRVNTTMAVWMGTTIACAQCHTHKYDPITITEYYQFYDFLNQTADADKKDEAPFHSFFTPEQQLQRSHLQTELATLEKVFAHPKPEILTGLAPWEKSLPVNAAWQTLTPSLAKTQANIPLEITSDARIFAPKPTEKTTTAKVELPLAKGTVEALRVEALTDPRLPKNGPGHSNGNFVLSQVRAEWIPDDAKPVTARYLRIDLISDRYDFLALAEVQVFSANTNIALKGSATQISTDTNGPQARLAIDGNTNGDLVKGKSVTITGGGEDQWWELDLGTPQPIDRITLWKRTDKGKGEYIGELKLTLLDNAKSPVWTTNHKKKNFASREDITLSGRREILFKTAFADATQTDFNASDVIASTLSPEKGWAIAGHTGKDHTLTLLPAEPLPITRPGKLQITLAQQSKYAHHTLGAFRISMSEDPNITRLANIPPTILTALSTNQSERIQDQTRLISDHYTRQVAPQLKSERQRLAKLEKDLAAIKPTTVPILTELPPDKHRKSHIQNRGEWQNLGAEVHAATPVAFHPLPNDAPRNRLTLARWLVSKDNPLTARVTVNRYWESLFGTGIVRTSEEFGSQGDLPVHPELLDFLAADLMDSGWNLKHLLKTLVTSQAYRQDSAPNPQSKIRNPQFEDPENRLLARGPRFRPSGELLRDQALAVSGLLSTTLGGPPVRPMTPSTGLSAAFGRSNDWIVSEGPDKHRRSLYTEVRRNSPYASFTTFDAGNREVCMIRRNRTNTPLQAFVTLNDPVFIETHQALARRLLTDPTLTTDTARLNHLFKLTLCRPPTEKETTTLLQVLTDTQTHFTTHPKEAETFATEPLGPLPKDLPPIQAATWTTLTNIVLNLDEFLMRR